MATTLKNTDYSYNNAGKLKNIFACVICILIPLFIGGLSGYITSGEINGLWFNTLVKPSFNPPNKIFGPVWTGLYVLMGVSLFMVWRSQKKTLRTKALLIFAIQLFLNFCWSILFFSLHLLFLSIVDIAIMWILILYMIQLFRKIKPRAGYLNIPYLLWISFATVLNISIWILNG